MKKNGIYALALGGIAVVIAIIALVMALGASGDDADGNALARIGGIAESVAAQNAEIQTLEAQVGNLQAELEAASTTASDEVAALQAAIEGIGEGADEPAHDYSADIQVLEADITALNEAVADNTESIDAIPDAMGTITTGLIARHLDEHVSLETAIQDAFDEHGVSHDALETAIEEAIAELMADADKDEQIAKLQERIDWLQQAYSPASTQAYVEEAIRYYAKNGQQNTIDYYNSTDSVDEDLYLFILDSDYKVIVHPTVPGNIGEDIRGELGTDITGKNFGAEFVGVNENGKWIDYVYLNPANDFRYERKHTWAVRHDHLIFASGWYERGVSLKDSPAAYTRAFVQQAIARYESEGREATLAYYKDPVSVDGQWYIFIVEDGINIGSATRPDLLGTSTKERKDITGKPYGLEIAEATEEGRWVDYVFLNPQTGEQQQKHSWVQLHDGLVFGSGWYESVESLKTDNPKAFTLAYVARALRYYDDNGLDATIERYNSSESVDGQWYMFVADAGDFMLVHPISPDLIGTDIKDIVASNGYELGKEIAKATEEGHWVEYLWPNPATDMEEPKRSWVIRHDGLIFGSGYYGE